MDNFSSFFGNSASLEITVYIGIAVVVLAAVWIISNLLQRRKADKRLQELEVEVNEIRNNALAYKYNRASAFARVNDEIMERVSALSGKYDVCQRSISTCEDLLAKADDQINAHQIKKAMLTMNTLETNIEDTKERIQIVSQSLDHILARETEVREKSNALKERFRNVKTVFSDNRASYYNAAKLIDLELADIENEFSNFEEWMFASEFNKAKEEVDKIAQRVDKISSQIAAYPGLYEKAKSILPAAVDEVKNNILVLTESKIDLNYLEPVKKIDAISNALVGAVVTLDNGDVDGAANSLNAAADQLLNLQDDVLAEKQAYEEIHSGVSSTFDKVDEIEKELEEIVVLYANIRERFGLEDWTKRFELLHKQMDDLKSRRTIVSTQLAQSELPRIQIISDYRMFCDEVNEFSGQVKELKARLVGASSDEVRAKKQVVKLQLILNEVRMNTLSKQLPSISDQFMLDLQEGQRLISRVRSVLDHSPLDIQTLNADLQDAIDFIYRLYNNSNNLVGVAAMVENAIVFGNRYRSSYPKMDQELTKAEICFDNGEYTRALKIAIQAIEDLHPGIYEKMVARKETAIN
jgi:septation ring formation regulator